MGSEAFVVRNNSLAFSCSILQLEPRQAHPMTSSDTTCWQNYRRSVGILSTGMLIWLATGVVSSAGPAVHYQHNTEWPPGAIGQLQLTRGGPLSGYFQPVQITGPPGVKVALAVDGAFGAQQAAPVKAGMLIGRVYRFRVTGIPVNEGLEVYPTIEVINRLYPPPGAKARFPIPVDLTREELEMALKGKMVSRIVYLENPRAALPKPEDPERQRYFEIRTTADPLQVADQLGRPVAILRMGGRLPSGEGPDDSFLFGSPPLESYADETDLPPASAKPDDLGQVNRRGTELVSNMSRAVDATYGHHTSHGPTHPPRQSGGPIRPALPDLVTVDPNEPWAPPGIEQPWPPDEYLYDGGDRNVEVDVGADWSIAGLDIEDTVGHFDTVHGRTVVAPSNRVKIYAPRFAAVRKVFSYLQHERHERIATVELPIKLNLHEEVQIAATANQPVQPRGQIGRQPASQFRHRLRSLGVVNSVGLVEFDAGFMAYENFQVIRHGLFDQSEKARLAERIVAAHTWSHDKAVQVVLDETLPAVDTADQRPQLATMFERPLGRPRLQVVKVASQESALPGESIDFTLRFDNVGDEPIGNVTIIDNLTTRLEYVPDSGQSSLAADFFTQENEGESLVLRWEIKEPLKPGEGGIIRFRCRVR